MVSQNCRNVLVFFRNVKLFPIGFLLYSCIIGNFTLVKEGFLSFSRKSTTYFCFGTLYLMLVARSLLFSAKLDNLFSNCIFN